MPDQSETLEADEFVCAICNRVSREHPKDGLAECEECVEEVERG